MFIENKILTDKHILRKKKYNVDGIVGQRSDHDSEDKEWAKIIAGESEKEQGQFVMDFQDRTITVNKDEAATKKEKEFKNKSK